MVYDAGVGPQYQGYLRKEIDTIAELLKRKYNHSSVHKSTTQRKQVNEREGGEYATLMVGKWHVGGEYPPDATFEWIQNTMGDETHPTPTQRGFDDFFGTLGGGGSYYQPPSLVRGNEVVREQTPEGFYYTDAINDEACSFIKRVSNESNSKPFFIYVSHCAPHWPLHAPKSDIDKYKGTYIQGWDELRKQRHARLVEEKIIPPEWECSHRDEFVPPWNSDNVINREWEDSRMATYAAQITIMDRGIGRIIDTLHETKMYDNTVIFFLSDNGGCAEHLKENGEEGHWPEFYGGKTRDGIEIQVGNRDDLEPGGEETFMSYDISWANASNTPFRLFKSWVHEGGISTPLIVHWPAAMSRDSDSGNQEENTSMICHSPWIIMDIVATCCELADVPIPSHLEGESFLPLLLGDTTLIRKRPIFWEHQGNRAVRDGKWKLVYRRCEERATNKSEDGVGNNTLGWELYNMENDRTEMYDLSNQHKDVVARLAHMWDEWAERCLVKPWPLRPIPVGEKDWSNLPWMW